MLCTFFVYVHFSSAFNFVNGDPIRKIQSFLLVSLRNLHSVKNVPNISSRQKTILQTRLNHKLESNLDKKKNFTKRSSIFQHYFEEIFFEEYFKKREIRFFQPSNEYTSFSYLSSKLDNSRFPQGNEKLPRKQEFLDKAVQAVSLSRKRKPSTPSQDLFLPVDPFEPSFSIDFFFFFFFFSSFSIQLLRFTATIVPHFARSHATRPAVRTVNDFESAREAHERRERVNIRAASSTTMFLFRLSWWNSSNGDARNGNRKFFGCSTGESVEFVGVALPRIFLFEGC